MSRYFLIGVLLLLAFSARAQFGAVKKNLNQKPIQDRYMAYLEEKGYSPEIDKDGDIKFTYNKRGYYITIDLKDKNFFRVARLANLRLNSEADDVRVQKVCHEVTRDVKVTKVYWFNGQIWASSELLIANPDDFSDIFERTVKLTESAYLKFVKDWKASGTGQ